MNVIKAVEQLNKCGQNLRVYQSDGDCGLFIVRQVREIDIAICTKTMKDGTKMEINQEVLSEKMKKFYIDMGYVVTRAVMIY